MCYQTYMVAKTAVSDVSSQVTAQSKHVGFMRVTADVRTSNVSPVQTQVSDWDQNLKNWIGIFPILAALRKKRFALDITFIIVG